MALSVYDVLEFINDFDENLSNSSADRTQTIIAHLKKVDKLNFRIPDFKQGLEWLNVSKPLTLEHLKGHIVILDFFTYCCINCMHILPDLEIVEEKFPPQTGVVVVGVHSAKFLNEKVTANILSAVLRYNITHPVVNDKDADLWQVWENLFILCRSLGDCCSLTLKGHGDAGSTLPEFRKGCNDADIINTILISL